jgi:hypothetical protein
MQLIKMRIISFGRSLLAYLKGINEDESKNEY